MKIEGMEKLLEKIGRLKTGQYIKTILTVTAEILKGKTSKYPDWSDTPDANGRWYERGYGPRWQRKSGGVGGRKTSENLGRKWYTRVSTLRAEIGNTASYAAYVHNKPDQAWFHRKHGWSTIQDVYEDEISELEAKANEIIEKELNKQEVRWERSLLS